MGPSSSVEQFAVRRDNSALRFRLRRPALLAVMALSAGICADRYCNITLNSWLIVAVSCLGVAMIGLLVERLDFTRKKNHGGHGKRTHFVPSMVLPEFSGRGLGRSLAASLAVLTVLAAVGGARHHLFWSIRKSNDIAAYSAESSQPVRLVGVIADPIEILDSRFGPRIPSWMEIDRSTCQLACEQLQDGDKWVPISGRVRLDIEGHLVHVVVGDRVEVVGQLAKPGPPRNPGAADYRVFLRAQGMSSLLFAKHPAAVRKLERLTSPGWALLRWRESMRAACQRLFANELRPRDRALAASLLLGDRTLMTDELRDQFAESGMMHLLAISGLNVGILLGLILTICKLFNLSSRGTAAALLMSIVIFAAMTNHQPSVLRASLLAAIVLAGSLRSAQVSPMQSLAVCALALLLIRPGDLFDIGAQLSYLAVGALFWSTGRAWAVDDFKNPALPKPEGSRILRPFLPFARSLGEMLVVTSAIWLATLPLTLSTFHLAAPIGALLNLVLIPLGALVLGLGYTFVLIGLLIPSVARYAALPFAWSLVGLRQLVEWGQAVPLGHLYLPGLPWWWLVGFYLLLAVAGRIVGTRQAVQMATRGLLVWIILGLLLPWLPRHRDSLRVTFLSVGHGLATVLELPTGETLAYDAGTLGDGTRAERAVENYLWSRGCGRIDALILTHADHDHYSGMFGLLERLQVGSLFTARTSLDFLQIGIEELCELAAKHKIPVRLVQAGDQFVSAGRSAESSTEIRVLHPAGRFESKSDNANSVVLDVRFAGKRILLTGDLELDGLVALLELPCERADVLLAPHHGGKSANIPALYEQVQPEYVVVSTNHDVSAELLHVVGEAQLLSTATSGAVTFEIRSDGQLTMTEFLKRAAQRVAIRSD